MPPTLRKTRFVCVSDTHNACPPSAFRLPKGDVLIHAGDLTKQGTFAELQKSVKWIEDSDFEVKIVVAGNHDITLDEAFYAQHAAHFHNQYPQISEDCIRLIRNSRTIVYLNHESANIRLLRQDGPETYFKVFGSPLSPAKGLWAFQYAPESAVKLWDKIDLDTDIVITHTPPKYHCDESKNREAAGCEALRQALWRVRPRLSICGHVHEGRGAELVRWDLTNPNVPFKEHEAGFWRDPNVNNKKQALIDLTIKGGEPLDNCGMQPSVKYSNTELPHMTHNPATKVFMPKSQGNLDGNCSSRSDKTENQAEHATISTNIDNNSVVSAGSGTRGQGGTPASGRCDMEALTGRLGRKETCVINAAIMFTSFPYASGGSRYNKPIVIDIDLPTWSGNG